MAANATGFGADEPALTIESETGGGQGGIEVCWTARHGRVDDLFSVQTLSTGAGLLT